MKKKQRCKLNLYILWPILLGATCSQLHACSTIFISSSDLPNHWSVAHILDACSAILVSRFETSDLLNHWRVTHKLDMCSAILVSFLICPMTGVTYILGACSAILVSGFDLLNHGKQLTIWMHVQPFLSVLISITEEQLTHWMHVQPFLSVILICSNTEEQLTSWMHVQPFLSVVLICNRKKKW